MCGLVGLSGSGDVNVAPEIYDALTVLQHRGQDAAGIMTFSRGRFNQRKSEGLVRDVFRQQHMQRLEGSMGIGHVRYPTAGSSGPALAQPFYVNSPYGIALAHNGNLTNAGTLTRALVESELRHLNTDSDSEVLLNILAYELQQLGKLTPLPSDIFAAVVRCTIAVAVPTRQWRCWLIMACWPFGIQTASGPWSSVTATAPAAESTWWPQKASRWMWSASRLSTTSHRGKPCSWMPMGFCTDSSVQSVPTLRPCIFEHVYFARPDSMIDRISVYKTRMRQGSSLARKIQRERPHHDIDVVIPIPDTSRTAGQSLAHDLGIKFREGFIKNRYIGRTFIMPGQRQRRKSVRQKLNPIRLEFEGKNVMLVDDSIVRGTTSREIIQMARDAGAARVYIASAAPPVRYPNVYGIDMPSAGELIAHDRTIDEVCAAIGADWLVYQDLDDLIRCSQEGNSDVDGFDCSVFDGQYITGDVDAGYLRDLDVARNDDARAQQTVNEPAHGAVVGIHNDR